jgi:uncharacterized protein
MTPARYPSIQVLSGPRFSLLDPRPEDVRIVDIAHSLAHLCRYTGHCSRFYSVAQHSVLTSRIVPEEHTMAALLHDAAEAYIGDISRPMKDALRAYPSAYTDSAGIDLIEKRVEWAVAQRFGFEFPFHPSVKAADNKALLTEQRDLMPLDPILEGWPQGEPLPDKIHPVGPSAAEAMFIARFVELGGEL